MVLANLSRMNEGGTARGDAEGEHIEDEDGYASSTCVDCGRWKMQKIAGHNAP